MLKRLGKQPVLRSAFTIAIGSKAYWNYAITLARSFCIHNSSGNIQFYIITDTNYKPPADLRNINIIRIDEADIGKGITSKLYLDKLAPTKCSLFIDADCLCYGDLTPVFDKFEGKAVSVVGFQITQGEWCGAQSELICKQFKIDNIPRFNGGVYYIEKGDEATAVYETARGLLSSYDQLGFTRHRGWANEEPLMSVSMACRSQEILLDDGGIMSDLASCLDAAKLDVLTGTCVLSNPDSPDPKHKWWYGVSTFRPLIIHFSGGMGTCYPYTMEKLSLALRCSYRFPVWLAKLVSSAVISVPYFAKKFLKNALRPAYRTIFGFRTISKSDRTFAE